MIRKFIYTAVGVIVAGTLTYFLWTSIFSPSPELVPVSEGGVGASDISTSIGTPSTATTSEGAGTQTTLPPESSRQKIFKITDGPVSSAVFIESKNPTTTLARYTLASNGHSFDLALDIPGAVAKAISNTTIPGIARTLWGREGRVAIMQYFEEEGGLKTVTLNFQPLSTSTVPLPVKIQFFPDGIYDIALSPDGTQAAYLLRTAGGMDGYIAKSDGSGSKKAFSIPLSQVLLSWPSPGTILVQSKSAYNTPGILFSVDVSSGNVVPLVYANGLIATADPSFSHIVYQSTAANINQHVSYSYEVQSGRENTISFDPLVEKCIWNPVSTAGLMYCARPLASVAANYIDLWHIGTASFADTIFAFNLNTNSASIVASPGGNQGGVQSDIAMMSLSPNNRYLLFITKGDRSLWGVRLLP